MAVAVLDVLPGCLSSVYFFWEPTLSFLTLGKVSALQEIAFVQAAASTCPSLHYYYMGYFIPRYPRNSLPACLANVDCLPPPRSMSKLGLRQELNFV